MISLELAELRVESQERLHAMVRRLDPFQRLGLPLSWVREIDAVGRAGMCGGISAMDPFQNAPRFPLATMPGGMSVTEYDRENARRTYCIDCDDYSHGTDSIYCPYRDWGAD